MSRVDAIHGQNSSPTGRLDAYIRSFEERYGAVPIESLGLNDSLASVSSISLEASGTKEPIGPIGQSRPPIAVAVDGSTLNSFTPRFQWEKPFPSTSLRGVPMACVAEVAAPVMAPAPPFSPSPGAHNTHCGHSDADSSRISVQGQKLSASAFNNSLNNNISVTGTTAAGDYWSASDTLDLRLRSPVRPVGGSVGSWSHGSRWSHGSHWSQGAPWISSDHGQLSSSQVCPSKKPERARASSNPPELKMRGPRGGSFHPNRGLHQGFQGPNVGPQPSAKIGMSGISQPHLGPGFWPSFTSNPSGSTSFVHPLPAPRGPRPRLNSASASVASRRPPLGQVDQVSAEGERDEDDEVNCQSPVEPPPPSKLLQLGEPGCLGCSGGCSAVEGEIGVPETTPDDMLVQDAKVLGTVCDTGVQTEGCFFQDGLNGGGNTTFCEAKQGQASQATRRRNFIHSPMPVKVPHSPPDKSLKQVVQRTPDFGGLNLLGVEAVEASESHQASYQAGQSDTSDTSHFGIQAGSMKCELPEVSGSKFNAGRDEDVEKLKERLQNALARSLGHLMNLQALTAH